ncbi:MAG: hypothetical protein KAJ03_05020, partial [Gammaproteobacteria bacterium]|nr:hypothetical protein [Gammaproteobacteria bacterium]
MKNMTNYLYRLLFASFCLVGMSSNTFAWTSKDGSWVAHGYLENSTHTRHDVGLSRSRTRGQLEWSKNIGSAGAFRNVSMNGILRGSYDAAYDFNNDDFGDDAGGPVLIQSTAGFAPPGTPVVGTFVNYGQGVPLF